LALWGGELEEGLDFFEEDCVEHFFGRVAAEDGVDFGGFDGVGGD
jgi:hypothetical protein